jgi:hypothetical protein
MGWKLDTAALAQIDRIVTDCVRDPVDQSSWHLRRGLLPECAVSHRGWRNQTDETRDARTRREACFVP